MNSWVSSVQSSLHHHVANGSLSVEPATSSGSPTEDFLDDGHAEENKATHDYSTLHCGRLYSSMCFMCIRRSKAYWNESSISSLS